MKRGIEYKLSFKQWLDVWGDKILDENRGQHGSLHRLRLERIDKTGDFEIGNVVLTRRLQKGELKKVAVRLEKLLAV